MEGRIPPIVSIITPYFKAQGTIKETILSVQNQTFTDWELIIIDDNSEDNVELYLADLLGKDNRIRVIKNSERKGAAGARNSGIENAVGQYIAFLDSDDLWGRDKLSAQLSFMQSNNCSFSYGDYYSFSKTDESGLPEVIGSFSAPNQLTFSELCNTCSIGCLTVMLDRSKLQDVYLPYTDKEDYALWLKLTKQDIIAYNYGGCDAYYRVGKNSLSSNKFKEVVRQYRVVRKVAGLSRVKAVWALLNYVYFGLKKHKNYRSSND